MICTGDGWREDVARRARGCLRISGDGVSVWRERALSISEDMTCHAGLRRSHCGVGERTEGGLWYGVIGLRQGAGDTAGEEAGVLGELEETEEPLSEDHCSTRSGTGGTSPSPRAGRASGLNFGACGVDTPAIFLRRSMAR